MKRGRKPTAHGPETPPSVGGGWGWEKVRLYEQRENCTSKERKKEKKEKFVREGNKITRDKIGREDTT